MTRALVTSSKYSPGNMTPEALEALFVGREKTLNDVLKRIAASATGAGKHFLLLVGPRGVGKTHFIALLHHRLMTDPQYEAARNKLRIAYLNEEEWGVASFLDLLVRLLNALAASYGDKDLEAQIERIYETHEKNPAIALEVAQSILIDYVGKHTLLLLCENLFDLFEGLGEEGQKRWRSFIQEHPFWTILATTPALFAGVQLQTSPFYGFFTERHLEKLDFETAVRLLQKKAEIDKRRELAHVLGTPTGRARVRAIHHLAAGNHRVYVTMSEFLDRESLDDLVTPFLRMVDDLTPYYQDRMRQLAPQQRKLVEFLSRHETPAMVKEVARRCLISQQTAAKQLGELAKLGFVQAIKSGRATYYELTEPLMRICIEVKDNKTQHLKLFVRFLREWFSARELICFQGSVLGALGKDKSVILNEDRLLAIDPTHAHAIYAKGKALVNLGRFVEAESVVLSFLENVPRAPDGLLLAALAKTGAHGFKVGAEYLAASLSMIPTIDGRLAGDDFEPAGVLATMMQMAAFKHGPLNMAEQVIVARSTLEKPGLDELFADALMRLLRALTSGALMQGEPWEEAVRAISGALHDLPECELPLKMLGAAARYSHTHDVADLLGLPIEQRSLLLDAFAEHARVASPALAALSPPPPVSSRSSSDARRRKSA